jgi:hypothetical protein
VGSGGIATPFLTSALDRGKWSASYPGRFTTGIHWIGGWMGPRAGLDAVEYRQIFFPCRESNSVRPAPSLSLYWVLWFVPWVVGRLLNYTTSHAEVIWRRMRCQSGFTYEESHRTAGGEGEVAAFTIQAGRSPGMTTTSNIKQPAVTCTLRERSWRLRSCLWELPLSWLSSDLHQRFPNRWVASRFVVGREKFFKCDFFNYIKIKNDKKWASEKTKQN